MQRNWITSAFFVGMEYGTLSGKEFTVSFKTYMPLLYGPAIAFLDIDPKGMKICSQKTTCTNVHSRYS